MLFPSFFSKAHDTTIVYKQSIIFKTLFSCIFHELFVEKDRQKCLYYIYYLYSFLYRWLWITVQWLWITIQWRVSCISGDVMHIILFVL